MDEDEAAKLVAAKVAEGESHDRGWYRVNAIRGLSGGRKLIPKVHTAFQEVSRILTAWRFMACVSLLHMVLCIAILAKQNVLALKWICAFFFGHIMYYTCNKRTKTSPRKSK